MSIISNHLPHLWMDNNGPWMVHVWVKEAFLLSCIIQSGNTNGFLALVSPIDITAHPVNGQTFTVTYIFVQNNWTLWSIYFLPFNYISGNSLVSQIALSSEIWCHVIWQICTKILEPCCLEHHQTLWWSRHKVPIKYRSIATILHGITSQRPHLQSLFNFIVIVSTHLEYVVAFIYLH